MAVSVGLISKCLAGACCVGVVGCGGGAVNDRGNETALDREVYEASGTGNWSQDPTDSSSVTAGQTVKITGSTTLDGKNGKCTISGVVPEGVTTDSTVKISEQLNNLKTGLGITNGTGNPSNENKGKKFFDKCRKARTTKENLMVILNRKAESTVIMEVKKNGDSSNEYKFDETKFGELYTAAG